MTYTDMAASTPQELLFELRTNIILVFRKFGYTGECNCRYSLDLFLITPQKILDDYSTVVGIAVQIEGVEEALDGEPAEVLMECLREIRVKLRAEMARIS